MFPYAQQRFGAVKIALKYTHNLNALERVYSLYLPVPVGLSRAGIDAA